MPRLPLRLIVAGAADEDVVRRAAAGDLRVDVADGDGEDLVGEERAVRNPDGDLVRGRLLGIEEEAVGDDDLVAGDREASAGRVDEAEGQGRAAVRIARGERADDGSGAGKLGCRRAGEGRCRRRFVDVADREAEALRQVGRGAAAEARVVDDDVDGVEGLGLEVRRGADEPQFVGVRRRAVLDDESVLVLCVGDNRTVRAERIVLDGEVGDLHAADRDHRVLRNRGHRIRERHLRRRLVDVLDEQRKGLAHARPGAPRRLDLDVVVALRLVIQLRAERRTALRHCRPSRP